MIYPNLESERQKQSTVPNLIDFKGPLAFMAGFFWVHATVHCYVVPTLPLKPPLGGAVQLPIYIPNWKGEVREMRRL